MSTINWLEIFNKYNTQEIIMGKILKETGYNTDSVKEALKKVVSAKHPELYDKNLNAINIGFNL